MRFIYGKEDARDLKILLVFLLTIVLLIFSFIYGAVRAKSAILDKCRSSYPDLPCEQITSVSL